MNDSLHQSLCEEIRGKVPGFLAAGIFGFADGRMLGVESDVPDTNRDHMSGSHARIFDRMMGFLELLPTSISGTMHSVVLDLESASFFMTMDPAHTLVVMVACRAKNGNLGMIRVVARRYLERAMQARAAGGQP